MFRQPLLSFSERLSTRCRCSRQWAIIGPLVSVHRPVFFFPDVNHFPDLSVHPVAFSVDHLGVVPVYDVVQRDGVVCDCRLCCCGFTGASCVCTHIALCDFLSVFLKTYTESSARFTNVVFVTVFTWYFVHAFTCILLSALVLWMYKETSYWLKRFHDRGNTTSSVCSSDGFWQSMYVQYDNGYPVLLRKRYTSEKKKTRRWTETRNPINFHTSMTAYCPLQWHLVDSRSDEGSSGCRNVNNKRKRIVNRWNYVTYD